MTGNPEALLDVLSVQSMREKYGAEEHERPEHVINVQNQQEFENFVRDFPIDDSISECFADTETDDGSIANDNQSCSLGQNSLKKKIDQAYSVDYKKTNDSSSTSSESKKSKIGSLFNRRKSKQTDSKPTGNPGAAGITDVIIDACLHITDSYKRGVKYGGTGDEPTQSDGSEKGSMNYTTGRVYYMDFEHTMEESELLFTTEQCKTEGKTETIQQITSDTTRISKPLNISNTAMPTRHDHTQPRGATPPTARFTVNRSNSSGHVNRHVNSPAHRTNSLQPLTEEFQRDELGNTVLHMSVVEGNVDAVKRLADLYPHMRSRTNNEGMTAAEVAIKIGQSSCLKVLLDKANCFGELTQKFVSRLLYTAASYGQTECFDNVIKRVPKKHLAEIPLPVDEEGSTASHVAALRGYEDAIHTLVAEGCSVSRKNNAGYRPIHIAQQNKQRNCFHYLILYDICRSLLREVVLSVEERRRLNERQLNTQTSLQQLNLSWLRYRTHLSEAIQGISDTKTSLLISLESLHTKLANSSVEEMNSDLSAKLDDLRTETERVHDLLEFSPLAEMTVILDKVSAIINDIAFEDETERDISNNDGDGQDCESLMREIMREVHEIDSTQIDTDEIIHRNIRLLDPQINELPNTMTTKCTRKITSCLNTKASSKQNNFVPSIRQDGDDKSDSSISTITDSQRALESSYATTTSAVSFNNKKNSHSRDWADYFGKSTNPCDNLKSASSISDWSDDNGEKNVDKDEVDYMCKNEVYNYVRLNLENENLPDEELRKHRLSQHLHSIAKVNMPRGDLVESVTTSSGEKIFHSSKKKNKEKIAEDLKETCQEENASRHKSKPNTPTKWFKGRDKTSRIKLFTLDELVATQEFTDPDFFHSYSKSHVSELPSVPWDEVVLTDYEEGVASGRPWYDLSDEEDSIIQTWHSEDEENAARHK